MLVLVTTMGPATALAQRTDIAATTTRPFSKVEQNAKTRAGEEIDRRIKALTALQTRVESMVRVTSEFKQVLASNVRAQISSLTTLKSSIAAQTDVAALKEQVHSITTSYRTYALVMPQTAIAAAADRVVATATMMQAVGKKLETRLLAVQNSGHDVTASVQVLSELQQKLTSAVGHAGTAVTLTASLSPDGGDKVKMESNTKALQEGRSEIAAAQKDLADARALIAKLVKDIRLAATATTTPAQ